MHTHALSHPLLGFRNWRPSSTSPPLRFGNSAWTPPLQVNLTQGGATCCRSLRPSPPRPPRCATRDSSAHAHRPHGVQWFRAGSAARHNAWWRVCSSRWRASTGGGCAALGLLHFICRTEMARTPHVRCIYASLILLHVCCTCQPSCSAISAQPPLAGLPEYCYCSRTYRTHAHAPLPTKSLSRIHFCANTDAS